MGPWWKLKRCRAFKKNGYLQKKSTLLRIMFKKATEVVSLLVLF